MLKSLEMHNYSSSSPASGGHQRPRPCCCLNFNASETSPLPFLSLQSPPRYTPPLSSTFISLWRVVDQENYSNDNSAHWKSIHSGSQRKGCGFSGPWFLVLIPFAGKHNLTTFLVEYVSEKVAEKDCPLDGQNIPNVQFSTTLVCCPPPPCRLSGEPPPHTQGILNTVSIPPPSHQSADPWLLTRPHFV